MGRSLSALTVKCTCTLLFTSIRVMIPGPAPEPFSFRHRAFFKLNWYFSCRLCFKRVFFSSLPLFAVATMLICLGGTNFFYLDSRNQFSSLANLGNQVHARVHEEEQRRERRRGSFVNDASAKIPRRMLLYTDSDRI